MRQHLTPVLLAAAALAAAQTPVYNHCVSNEQMRHYQTVSGPQLSPDGTRVVYVQHESTADGAGSHIWLAPSDGSAAARQITFSPASDHAGESAPVWLPDGSGILFAAKRGEVRQIFRLPLDGGEAQALEIKVHVPGAGAKAAPEALNAGAFDLSPDGRTLAIRAPAPQTAAEKADVRDKKDARTVGVDTNPQRLWLYTLATGQVTEVSFGDSQPRGLAWSHDSRELAVITAPPGDADDLGPANRVEIVRLDDPAHPRTLSGAPASASGLAFSPDGTQLAVMAQTSHDAPPGISGLYVLPVGGGEPRELSVDTNLNVAGRPLLWSAEGSAIYVAAQEGTESGLARFPASGGDPQWIAPAPPDAGEFATNARQTGWVMVTQSTAQMPQVRYAARLDAAPGAALSHANADWAADGWAPASDVSWKGPDGMAIHGLYYPPNGDGCTGAAARSDGKAPMILVVHGGPTGAFGQSFSPLVQWLTAQGWAVLEPNPRGSTGYGWQFAAANKNDLGGKDFQDVMAGVDWALAHEPIDPQRLGVYGYSYGGEMAGFIEGKTTRFAAIVSGAPVIDQYSEYGTESGSWYDRWFFGKPWMNASDAWRQSPLSFAGNAKTPLLLLQGQADTTDPLGQSEEEYRALRQMGVPVKLMTFPRENHGPLSGGIGGSPSVEPWHGFEARIAILDWYNRHFAQAPGAATAAQP